MESSSREELIGQKVFDRQGKEVGEILEVYRGIRLPIALLAKVRLPNNQHAKMIPLATAKPINNGIQAPVNAEKIWGSPTIKSGRSVVVSPSRVQEIYRYHDVSLPKRFKAVKSSSRRPGEVLYLDLPPGVRTGRTWKEILRDKPSEGK